MAPWWDSTMPAEDRSAAVLGVDACAGGWVGIVLLPTPPVGGRTASVSAVFGATIAALVSAATTHAPVAVVAIDIPLGLADHTDREPDVLAKKLVGPRHSSVFMTPPRPALVAATRAEADAISRQLVGKGVSSQAFALAPKLLEANRWAPTFGGRVVEVHPEVSFATLAGGFLEPKRSWAGAQQRRELLLTAGITLPDELGEAGRRAGVDDVLDAAVAAWTATRVLTGTAVSHPREPVRYSDGWPCAIWV
jgi:predicted RNase H-like nuclease